MEKINIVVCSNDTEYKVALKNKLVDENLAIIGYSEIEPGAKVRIQGFVPDIVAFLVDSMDINPQFIDYIEEMNLASIGAIPVRCLILKLTAKNSATTLTVLLQEKDALTQIPTMKRRPVPQFTVPSAVRAA